MANLTTDGVIHYYAGWPGKSLCGAESAISSINSGDVTCAKCKEQLRPAPVSLKNGPFATRAVEIYLESGRTFNEHDDSMIDLAEGADDNVRFLEAEIERLRGKLDAAEQHVKILQAQVQSFSPETSSNAADAARYRWLKREAEGALKQIAWRVPAACTDEVAGSVDAQIDAARGAEKASTCQHNRMGAGCTLRWMARTVSGNDRYRCTECPEIYEFAGSTAENGKG